jgi:membrane complex biogenesis BtpA family protein
MVGPIRSLQFRPNTRLLIGVVHLRPLPGAPRWAGDIQAVIDAAIADARAYERGGADAVLIENYGDLPFTQGPVPPETVAAMAVVGRAVRQAIGLPLGFNVLRNDAHAALALCAACGGSFIRVNVHTGAMVTDQGLIQGQAFATMRLRRVLCPNSLVLADVQVKHALPLAPLPIDICARDTLERGLADGLIISGIGTGQATDWRDLERVRAVCPRAPLLVGSGVTAENVGQYLQWANGFIVGSWLKRGGQVEQPVDPRRVAALAKRIKAGAAR